MHPLSFRINFKGEIQILSRKGREKKFRVLEDESIREIKAAIEKSKNVFIFSLRKGLATMTICRDCNETVSCKNCGGALVLYLSKEGKKRVFVCNRCQTNEASDTICATCGSWNLMPLGIGTDTVSEYVKKIFPKSKIFQLDKEVARTGKGAEKIIKEYLENKGSILIGTEMSFFYLKDKVALSVMASFDSLWSIPN